MSWEYPPNIIGGLGRHVHGLSEALYEQGVDVWVITRGRATAQAREFKQGVHVIRVDLPTSPDNNDLVRVVMAYNAEFVRMAMDLVKRIGPFDVIHAHDWLVAYSAIMLKNSLHTPLISTVHATEWGRNRGINTDLQKYISSVEWNLTYESLYVICCSRYMLSELVGIFSLPAYKIRVVPNGVLPPKPTMQGEDEPGLSPQVFPPDHRIIFFIGRLVYEKGIELLVRAFAEVKKVHGNIRLVIAGEGPEQDRLAPLIRDLGIGSDVVFLGFVDDATRSRVLKRADVAVFPSLYEPFGIVALETLLAECPIIVSDVGGLGEIIEHGRNGLKCRANSIQGLGKTILAALNRPVRTKRMAKAGYRDVLEYYSWKGIAHRTIAIYTEAVAESPSLPWYTPMSSLDGVSIADMVGMDLMG